MVRAEEDGEQASVEAESVPLEDVDVEDVAVHGRTRSSMPQLDV